MKSGSDKKKEPTSEEGTKRALHSASLFWVPPPHARPVTENIGFGGYPYTINVPETFSFDSTASIEETSSVVSNDAMSPEHHRRHCSFRTRIPVERRQITWIIKNFNSILRTRKRIPVSVESALREKSMLFLSCYVSGDCNSDGSVRIDIQRKDKDLKQMFVRCKVSVLERNSVAQVSQADEHLYGGDYEVWAFPPIVKLSTLENRKSVLLADDKLSLECEFHISYKGEEIFLGSCLKGNNSASTDDLKRDINFLLSMNGTTDVTLNSKDHAQCAVHKTVLCARSRVFQAMFSGDTLENQTGVVRITDIDSETLKNIVHFMYKDRLPELELEGALKLYAAADKYQITNLKDQCASSLKYGLSISNVCDVLELASVHQDAELMKYVESFMKVHAKEIFHSSEWENCMKDNIQLAGETMTKVLQKMTSC